jgi:hypothetical protein
MVSSTSIIRRAHFDAPIVNRRFHPDDGDPPLGLRCYFTIQTSTRYAIPTRPLRSRRLGTTRDEIVRKHPNLTIEDVEQALAYPE